MSMGTDSVTVNRELGGWNWKGTVWRTEMGEGRSMFWNCLTSNDVFQTHVAFFTVLSRQVNPQYGHEKT